MSWVHDNKEFLVAAIERLAATLQSATSANAAAPPWPEWSGDPHVPPAIEQLERRFGLTPFERDVLLLTAALELDGRFGALCAGAPGGGAAWPTFRLALATLPGGSWDALLPSAPLRRWELVRLESAAEASTARLRIDERVWHYLLGLPELDPRIRRCVRALPAGPALAASHRRVAQALALTWSQALDAGAFPIVRLEGRGPALQAAVAEAAAEDLGFELLRVPFDLLPADAEQLASFVSAWQREDALSNRALLIDCSALDANENASATLRLVRLLDDLGGPVIAAGWAHPTLGEKPQVLHRIGAAQPEEQRSAWRLALSTLGVPEPRAAASADELAARFDVDLPSVADTLALARTRLAAEPGKPAELALWDACRELARRDLGELARPVFSRSTWEDLCLLDGQRTQLQQLEQCARQQYRVHSDWDFGRGSERGRGIVALFSGPSGTGKTLAAEVIANALRLDLYRVDLSAVSSKWIGETEKNLRRVFDGAEAGGAILLFDEADALFGQRGEVKESRDRHANLEVNYLLQRVETFRGLAILTTNLQNNLDPAVQRRLRFIIEFSFPDARQRENIWRRVFPPATPTLGLDPALLARLSASGAEIHSIAWMAACIASAQGDAVRMRHILQATRWEYQKTQKILVASDIEGWDHP